jgi:hypothetical protein
MGAATVIVRSNVIKKSTLCDLMWASRKNFKVQGSRFKVQGSRFKVQGSRFKEQCVFCYIGVNGSF